MPYYATTAITGNGSQVTWNISWPYLAASDVHVYVDGTELDSSDFTVVGNAVTLDTAPGSSVKGFIKRQTALSTVESFVRLGTPSSGGFNATLKRVQYIAQELLDVTAVQINLVGSGIFDALGNVIRNVGDGSDSTDAVNKGQLDAVASAAQPLDAFLTSIAGLGTAANKILYTTAANTAAETALTSFMRTLLDDTDASTALSTLGVSAFVKTLLDDADAATARGTLGLVIGTDVQAYHAKLAALAGVTGGSDKLPYFNGTDTMTQTDLTTFGRTLIANANAGDTLTDLGVSAFVQTILDDSNAATVFGTLGISTFIQTLLDDADAATARGTLGLVIGTDVQAYHANLAALAGLTIVQGNLIYGSGAGTTAVLAKDTNSTRYLSNQGASNNPSWNQVNLANGVTGNLPVTNLNSGTGAGASTFWCGDGSWKTPSGAGDVSAVSTGTPQYTIPTWGAAGKTLANGISIGTSGQVLTSGGAGVAPSFSNPAYPTGYHGSDKPVYATSSTFTVANIRERSADDTVNITKTGSTTVDTTTTGLNGIAQSAALTGTVCTMPALIISAASTTTEIISTGTHGLTTGQPIVFKGTVPGGVVVGTVYYVNVQSSTTFLLYDTEANAITGGATGKVNITSTASGGTTDTTYIIGKSTAFNTVGANQLQVGDVVAVTGGQIRKVVTVSSDTQIIVDTGTTTSLKDVTIKRGGKANSAAYHLYTITDGSTPGLILSTRNVAGGDTLVDLPSGYSTTTARQIAFSFVLNSSGNIRPFSVVGGWPRQPEILFTDFEGDDSTSAYNVLTGGTATTAFSNPGGGVAISLDGFLPSTSKESVLAANGVYSSAASRLYVKPTDGTSTTGLWVLTVYSGAQINPVPYFKLRTNASQSISYRCTNAGSAHYIFVRGYVITEVQ